MGVPALFRWLSQKYPKIISHVIEEQPSEVDGQEIPVDTTGPNPNGEEMDNLYLDMNGIVHPCSHPEDRPPPATEEEMMLEVFKYTERVVNMVRPRKLLMIAVDGVAPRAKMNQQRSRRFRSAQEAKEKDEDKAEFLKMLETQRSKKSHNNGVIDGDKTVAVAEKTWDSNAITPGTPFMDTLAASLRYWTAYKLNTDPAWAKMKVIISDSTVPGEGEHKIMEFIRSQRSSLEHDPNTRHVIYGLDADLIMLGLATHEPYFRVLREDVFFREAKARTCQLCGQKGHRAEECRGEAKQMDGNFDEKDKAQPLKPFVWLHVPILREYLEVELYVPSQPHAFDLERAIDDWVFMCFFVGNDFLPHLPSLDIRENGIDTLITIWRDSIPVMGGYLTKDGHVDLTRAQLILDGLAKQEDAIFQRRRQAEERREESNKRQKLEKQMRESGSRHALRDGARDQSATTDQMAAGNRKGRGRPVNPTIPPPDLPLFAPGNITKEAKAMTYDMAVNRGSIYKANLDNKNAAAALKSQLLGGDSKKLEDTGANEVDTLNSVSKDSSVNLQMPVSALGKRKVELIEEDENITLGRNSPDTPGTPMTPKESEATPDTVCLWEEGYADRYYEQKFSVDAKDIGFRHKVARAYVEGLAWVLLYYFQGCPSWTWYYPYHYAPFAADFVDIGRMKIAFEKGKPFRPFEQLMGVLPAASKHALPEVFHGLMTEEESEIIDFYPEEFPIDLNGKKFAWQGVALLPFIDEKRLLDAMAKKYPLLSAKDGARNEVGKDVLLVSDSHPLYNELAVKFYSKKQESDKYKLNPTVSEGLAGKVEKHDSYLPRSTLYFPLENQGMPHLEEDRSISVYYDMPRSTNVHKSMLLRGVKLPAPTLNKGDIERTRNRAANSGRSYGGAPLRGGYGSGRGRPQDNRPLNPFPLPQTGGYGNYGNQSGYNGDKWRPAPGITQGSWLPPPPQPHRAPLQPPPGVRLGSVSYAYQHPHPHLVGQNHSGRAPPPPPHDRYNDRSDGRPGDRRQGGERYGDSQRYQSGYYSSQHDRRY